MSECEGVSECVSECVHACESHLRQLIFPWKSDCLQCALCCFALLLLGLVCSVYI